MLRPSLARAGHNGTPYPCPTGSARPGMAGLLVTAYGIACRLIEEPPGTVYACQRADPAIGIFDMTLSYPFSAQNYFCICQIGYSLPDW